MSQGADKNRSRPRLPWRLPDHKLELQESLRIEHRFVRIRMLGWILIGSWQLLSLLSEFVPLDLERRALRITGKALGLLGLVLVAYGFERLVELAHRRSGLHE